MHRGGHHVVGPANFEQRGEGGLERSGLYVGVLFFALTGTMSSFTEITHSGGIFLQNIKTRQGMGDSCGAAKVLGLPRPGARHHLTHDDSAQTPSASTDSPTRPC